MSTALSNLNIPNLPEETQNYSLAISSNSIIILMICLLVSYSPFYTLFHKHKFVVINYISFYIVVQIYLFCILMKTSYYYQKISYKSKKLSFVYIIYMVQFKYIHFSWCHSSFFSAGL